MRIVIYSWSISLFLSYLTWKLYGLVDWKFATAFIGGGIDAYVLYFLWTKDFYCGTKNESVKEGNAMQDNQVDTLKRVRGAYQKAHDLFIEQNDFEGAGAVAADINRIEVRIEEREQIKGLKCYKV